MKLLSVINEQILKSIISNLNEICHVVATHEGYKRFDPPKFAKDHVCQFCGCSDYFLWLVDKETRAWFCARICRLSTLPKSCETRDVHPTPKRSVLWPQFCEINGIGDLNHDIRFEKIHQSQKKLEFLLKFATHPIGIVYMQGLTGRGKTYAALGVCEFFTRTNYSCIFITYKGMVKKWLENDISNMNIQKFNTVRLLVIDDFGTGEPTKAFLEFFMELINFRIQWSDKGTIITTNLKPQELIKFCGDALFNRINTGQNLIFENENRRIPPPI